MKTKLNFILSVVVILMLIGTLPMFAGNDGRKGTAGATELLIPVGSRNIATSGAMIASVSGAEAIFWNPAGVARSEGVEVMFSNMQFNSIVGIDMNYFALAVKVGQTGTLAASLRTMDFGDIKITTTDFPEGTGGYYSPTYITFGLTFANQFTDRISGGASVKYVSEKIIRTSATGIAIDLGIQYASITGLKLGVALKNLGPSMKFDGPDLEFFNPIPTQDEGDHNRAMRLPAADFELPSVLEIGLGYDFSVGETNEISLGAAFQNNNFGSDQYRFGAEYCWDKLVYLRAGIMGEQEQSANIYGPTFGIGLNVDIGSGSRIVVDYAYRVSDFLDGNQWISVKLGL